MNTMFDDFLLSLAGVPALPGARCRGKAHLFDPAAQGEAAETVAARHNQARGLCSRCPALDACRAWVASLPRAKRPHGVVAGQTRIAKPGCVPIVDGKPEC